MGKPADDNRRRLNVRAAKLRREGHTNREIAEALDVDIDTLPGRITVGERILSLLDEEKE